MTKEKLTADYCKRFNESAPQLKFTHCGVLCTLLGSVESGPSLSCALSMGIDCAARKTKSGYIKIERTDSNFCLRIRPEELSLTFPKSFHGADILIHSSIAGSYDEKYPIRAALIKSLLRLIRKSETDTHIAAAMCENGRNVSIYNALLSAKKPYCTYIFGSETAYYPLPVTDTLFICVSFGNNLPRKPRILSGKYPTDETAMITEARLALKGFRFDRFADIVNLSTAADIRYSRLRREQRLLAETMINTEGCLCAHSFGGGIWALGKKDMIDNVINRAKNRFETRFGYMPSIAVAKVG